MSPRILPHVERIAGGKIEDSREVRQVARPVCPRAHEPGEITECFFGPDVNPALIRIARRKLDDGECKWRVKQQPGSDPYNDRTRSGRCGCRNPAQADAGHDIEQKQVTKT